MRLIIDNTSTSGTFFDNIHNTNWLVSEYDIDNIEEINDFKDKIGKSSKVYIKDDLVDNNGFVYYQTNQLYSLTKYDYINEDTIEDFKTPYYDKLFETINDSFIITKEQYNNWLYYQDEHKDCRIDKNTGKHKFGTIGGGSSLVFQINYCSEEMFPKFGFIGAKCNACDKISKLTGKNDPIENLDSRYEKFKKYGFKFNLVEFYRFIEIYNEYKSTMTISFMGTGLGNCISIKVKDFVFEITDNSHW